MKNRFKVVVSTVAALSLLSTAGGALVANAQSNEITEQAAVETLASVSIKPGQLAGLGFKVIKWASNTWLVKAEASQNIYDNSIDISSGTIGFNNKGDSGYGSSSKHDVKVENIGEQIQTFAETDFINMFTAKISVIITNPFNSDVLSKTVTHEQYVLYNPTATGTHTIRYVDENKLNWNLYITLRNYQISPSFNYLQETSVIDSQGTELPAVYNGDKIYIIPSKNHKETGSKQKLSKTTLSLVDLQNQFYDTTLQKNVRSLKNYNIGDSIHFKDTIASIKYDSDNNRTLIGFYDKDGDIVDWVFSNDLSNRFSVGDTIDLNLHVVEEVSGFENIDLIKNFQSNGEIAESIDKYLIQK